MQKDIQIKLKEAEQTIFELNDELIETNRGMVKLTLELQEAKEKYQKIFENSILGIFRITQDNKFKEVNPAMGKMLGYANLTDLINTIENIDEQLYVDFDRRKFFKQIISEHDYISNFESRVRKKNGDIIWISENTRILKNIKNEFLGYEGIVQDITENKKNQEELDNYHNHLERLVQERTEELEKNYNELQKIMKNLKRSNAELEQFAYVASHDLQEPLRLVASFTQLLQRRYQDKLDQDANDYINFAVEGAIRMQNLINDLLIFTKVGLQGKPFKTTDMNLVLKSVLTNLNHQIMETNAKITNDPLPVIFADDSQMIQLLQNLISNAIKFHGKDQPKIHISGEVRENDWVFSVKDNGIGIDPKHFSRLFIIFQRLNKKNEYSGTGIGLAVCKKIIKRHGGRIWIESEPGKGSIFYFSIPRNIKYIE